LDFGSAGNPGGQRSIITLTGSTKKALPFTTKPGSYWGLVGITPTVGNRASDGSAVRVWISSTAGGAPLSPDCASFIGNNGRLKWSQTPRSGSCIVPSQSATLYFNFGFCISSNTDATCSAPGVRFGSQSQDFYVQGRLYDS
jgi:hypothetical protein